ncbi:hypothetical protein SLEP1_g12126 [Rubroshorea leprosula]|nr:hypothetical protein SLEP1_g12126 [Rubroshorea leprosula]
MIGLFILKHFLRRFFQYCGSTGSMASFEKIVTHPAAAIVAKEDPQIGQFLRTCRKQFWGEAALIAIYVINRIPSSAINNKSPYECLHGTPPAYDLLKVLSSDQPPLFTNLFIELFPSDSDANTFDELRDASPRAPPSSIEDALPVGSALDNGESSSLPSSVSLIEFDLVELENEILNPPSSRPTRVRNSLNYLRDYHCFPAITSLHEPQSYQEASSNLFWHQVMQDELQALEKLCTWDLVDLFARKPLVGCKWVYKIKSRSDGFMERYKARSVAEGFTQEYGIDYEETFAPAARPTLVCSLIAIATIKGWKLFQIDVKNAFLNGDLAEEVYMQPPPRLEHPPNKVY